MEINASFYADIPKKVVTSWIKEFSGRDFLFSVKAPKAITHQYLKAGYDQVLPLMDKFLEDLVWPLADNGLLGRPLFQLPPFSESEELDNLLNVLLDSDLKGAEPRIEVRSGDMLNSSEVSSRIQRCGFLGVIQDSPDIAIENSLGSVGNTDYVRLHGRNAKLWNVPGSGLSRYEYLYSPAEVEGIFRILGGIKHPGDEIFIYFNNHPGGRATANAMSLQTLAGTGSRAKLF